MGLQRIDGLPKPLGDVHRVAVQGEPVADGGVAGDVLGSGFPAQGLPEAADGGSADLAAQRELGAGVAHDLEPGHGRGLH